MFNILIICSRKGKDRAPSSTSTDGKALATKGARNAYGVPHRADNCSGDPRVRDFGQHRGVDHTLIGYFPMGGATLGLIISLLFSARHSTTTVRQSGPGEVSERRTEPFSWARVSCDKVFEDETTSPNGTA